MKKLTQNQLSLLQAQYDRTPAKNETFGSTGEHWVLFHMVQQLGGKPRDEWDAINWAERILTNGYVA